MECATNSGPCGRCVIDLYNKDQLRNTPLTSIFLVPFQLIQTGTSWYFKKLRIKDDKIKCHGTVEITSNDSTLMGKENRDYTIEIIKNWYEANKYRATDKDVEIAIRFITDANEALYSNSTTSNCMRFIDILLKYHDEAAAYFSEYLRQV